MGQKMHDSIAISNSLGHPDVFITMTCNSYWPEVQSALLPKQRAEDRPDLCDRIFRMKLKLLLLYLKDSRLFGFVLAHVSAIEFLKRKLVHAHTILFLDQDAKYSLQGPLQVDRLISTEIPPKSVLNIRCTVLKNMTHKPYNAHASAPAYEIVSAQKDFLNISGLRRAP